jgi:hypothetical protein
VIEVRADRRIPATPDELWPLVSDPARAQEPPGLLRGLVISRALQDSLERLAAATS